MRLLKRQAWYGYEWPLASGLLVRGTLPRDQAVLTRSQPGAQYCTAARSPASVCHGECHMWIGTLCSTPNQAKCPTCQRLSCVKCNTLPRDSLHHFLYWSSEDFWNRWIQGGTKTIKQCHCQRWHLGFGKLAVPLWELVICTRWHGLLGSHSHEPMFPCFHLPPSY